jgi:hypothetical protein
MGHKQRVNVRFGLPRVRAMSALPVSVLSENHIRTYW